MEVMQHLEKLLAHLGMYWSHEFEMGMDKSGVER